MTKEYGGYLPIEFAQGTPYYKGEHIVALNSGRYAIAYALKHLKWNLVYLPFYLCSTVEETIKKELPWLQIRYYHIAKNFLPEDLILKENEGILLVNYFGMLPDSTIYSILQQYHFRVLVDNTQSFFSKPIDKVCQVYSCRKFFGVADGAYVIGGNILQHPVPASTSSLYALHLLLSYEHGTDYSYHLNKENEECLGICGIQAMSRLTSSMLNVVDYNHVQEIRLKNIKTLHKILSSVNEITLPELRPALYYPFLFRSKVLREKLIQRKIYIPQLWKEVELNSDASLWERTLSRYLCPLPIDQRYSTDDMETIGKQILQFIKNQKSERFYL